MVHKVKLTKSPIKAKKYRVTFADGYHVDFGASGYSDFTRHKNPFRMREYVRRHGGKITKSIMADENPNSVFERMLSVHSSSKEKWGKLGVKTAGFWSRWLLWSMPTLRDAKKLIARKYHVQFV
jgi:hypothetical protein